AGQRLDKALVFEPVQHLVQGAGGQADAGERLDVLGERVPVLCPVGQAGQDQRGRAGAPAQGGQRPGIAAAALCRRNHDRDSMPDSGVSSTGIPATETMCAATPGPRFAYERALELQARSVAVKTW